MSNPVFLFDLNQLGDANETRNDLFRKDVTKFMGLQEELPALPHHKPGIKRPKFEQKLRDAMKIDICEAEYKPVRQELMKLSRNTSWWLRHVFLNSPTVFVSSRVYLEEILHSWMVDPCEHSATVLKDEETVKVA
jgi:hypothetical protein